MENWNKVKFFNKHDFVCKETTVLCTFQANGKTWQTDENWKWEKIQFSSMFNVKWTHLKFLCSRRRSFSHKYVEKLCLKVKPRIITLFVHYISSFIYSYPKNFLLYATLTAWHHYLFKHTLSHSNCDKILFSLLVIFNFYSWNLIKFSFFKYQIFLFLDPTFLIQ